MWRKPSFKSLSPNAKLAYLFLITGPDTNMAGLVSYTIPDIADCTGIKRPEVKKAIRELVDAERLLWDQDVDLFLILRWFKHNPLTSPKHEISAQNVIAAWEWHGFHGIVDSMLSGTYDDTLSIPYREGIDTPQGQGQGKSQGQGKERGVEKSITEVIEYFKEVTNSPRVVTKAESNREFVRARLKEGISIEDLKAIVDLKLRQVGTGDFKEMYLRIATLFNGEKCHAYLGELDGTRRKPNSFLDRFGGNNGSD